MINAEVGSIVLLTCTASSTMPIEYTWLKDGSKLPQKCKLFNLLTELLCTHTLVAAKITYPGPGLLQVNKTSIQDEGIYSCEVSNNHGSAVRYFNLAVQSGKNGFTAVH